MLSRGPQTSSQKIHLAIGNILHWTLKPVSQFMDQSKVEKADLASWSGIACSQIYWLTFCTTLYKNFFSRNAFKQSLCVDSRFSSITFNISTLFCYLCIFRFNIGYYQLACNVFSGIGPLAHTNYCSQRQMDCVPFAFQISTEWGSPR